MNSDLVMPLRTHLDSYNIAVINGAQLILALEDLGYDDVTVDTVDGGVCASYWRCQDCCWCG